MTKRKDCDPQVLHLVTADGRLVRTMAGGPMDRMILPLYGVKSGPYILELLTADGHRVVQQLVKG